AAGAGAVGVLVGLLDLFTWGAPFSALKKYLYFNLKKSGAKYGRYPITYYVSVAWQAAGPAVLLIFAGLALSARLAPKLFLLVTGYALLHSVIPHKEFRFLMPVAPMAFALAGAGLATQLERLRRPNAWAAGLALLSAVWMAQRTTTLTWAKLGFP